MSFVAQAGTGSVCGGEFVNIDAPSGVCLNQKQMKLVTGVFILRIICVMVCTGEAYQYRLFFHDHLFTCILLVLAVHDNMSVWPLSPNNGDSA